MYSDSCTDRLPKREFTPIYMLNSEKEGFTILHSTIFQEAVKVIVHTHKYGTLQAV